MDWTSACNVEVETAVDPDVDGISEEDEEGAFVEEGPPVGKVGLSDEDGTPAGDGRTSDVKTPAGEDGTSSSFTVVSFFEPVIDKRNAKNPLKISNLL